MHPAERQSRKPHWITGSLRTPAGEIPRVTTSLAFADRMGSFKARTGINRMHYTVEPGLYALGNPAADSPVLVSANYKMSFDRLRSAMTGRDAWIMVLDTKGINVWCAAGKGTFGTDEIVHRVEATRLHEVVSHRILILPQLAAPGVAAHEVARRCRFRVVYGPVRAHDLPAYLDAGRKATSRMRLVTFGLRDRFAVIPIELVTGFKYVVPAAAALFLLSGLTRGGYSLEAAASVGPAAALLLLLGFAGGAVLTPMLLPWLPGRAFSTKGALIGVLTALAFVARRYAISASTRTSVEQAAWLLILPAVSSFFAMNFTGASTFTSLSGVKKEMRFAVPAQIALLAVGLGVWVLGRFAQPL